jgi:hypothetical protein
VSTVTSTLRVLGPKAARIECKRLWLLKNSAIGPIFVRAGVDTAEFFFLFLGGDSQRGGWLAEEAHQSLDVLRSRCQEELLAGEFHPTQAQAA